MKSLDVPLPCEINIGAYPIFFPNVSQNLKQPGDRGVPPWKRCGEGRWNTIGGRPWGIFESEWFWPVKLVWFFEIDHETLLFPPISSVFVHDHRHLVESKCRSGHPGRCQDPSNCWGETPVFKAAERNHHETLSEVAQVDENHENQSPWRMIWMWFSDVFCGSPVQSHRINICYIW